MLASTLVLSLNHHIIFIFIQKLNKKYWDTSKIKPPIPLMVIMAGYASQRTKLGLRSIYILWKYVTQCARYWSAWNTFILSIAIALLYPASSTISIQSYDNIHSSIRSHLCYLFFFMKQGSHHLGSSDYFTNYMGSVASEILS